MLQIHSVEFFSNCKLKRMNNVVILKAAIDLEELHKDLVTKKFCLLYSCGFSWAMWDHINKSTRIVFVSSEEDLLKTYRSF